MGKPGNTAGLNVGPNPPQDADIHYYTVKVVGTESAIPEDRAKIVMRMNAAAAYVTTLFGGEVVNRFPSVGVLTVRLRADKAALLAKQREIARVKQTPSRQTTTP